MARLESLDPDWQTTTTTFGSANWTQSADEIDTFVGSISYTLEAACAGYATQSLNVKILVDGAVVMATDLPTNDPGSTDTATLTPAESSVSNLLFEPGAPTQTHPLRHVHQLVWSRVDPGDPDQQRAPRCSRHSLAPLSRASKLANPLESPSERRLNRGRRFDTRSYSTIEPRAGPVADRGGWPARRAPGGTGSRRGQPHCDRACRAASGCSTVTKLLGRTARRGGE